MMSKKPNKPLSLEAHLKLKNYKEGKQKEREREILKMVGPSSRVMGDKAIGNKCKAIGNKHASPPSKKKSVPGGKTSCQGKVMAKSPAKGNNQRGHPPRKAMENLVSPQASQVQDQGVSPVQSVTAVSHLQAWWHLQFNP